MAGQPGEQKQRSEGGQRGRGVGNGTIHLLFLGIKAALRNPTKGNGNFHALWYNCSKPSDIKVHDAESKCKLHLELPGEKTTVKIIQLVKLKN